MANFSSNQITAVQAKLAPMGTGPTLLGWLETIDVIGQVVANPSGAVTTGGAGLTNVQYQQLYEMLC